MNENEERSTVPGLVAAWRDGERTMFDAVTEEPEVAWEAIVEISRGTLTEEESALLAGGPLETLLCWHGAAFIDRVVDEAKRSPTFNHLLGGVWGQRMPKDIWGRIEQARKGCW